MLARYVCYSLPHAFYSIPNLLVVFWSCEQSGRCVMSVCVAEDASFMDALATLGGAIVEWASEVIDLLISLFEMLCGDAFDMFFALVDSLLAGSPFEFLSEFNVKELIQEQFSLILTAITGGANVVMPQRICAGSERDLAGLGEANRVTACTYLDGFGEIDVFGFGVQLPNPIPGAKDQSFCLALSIETLTFAIAQHGLIPTINLPIPSRRQLPTGIEESVVAILNAIRITGDFKVGPLRSRHFFVLIIFQALLMNFGFIKANFLFID